MVVEVVVFIMDMLEGPVLVMDQVVVEVVLMVLVVLVELMDIMVDQVVVSNVVVVAVELLLLVIMVDLVVHLVMEELHLQIQLLDHRS